MTPEEQQKSVERTRVLAGRRRRSAFSSAPRKASAESQDAGPYCPQCGAVLPSMKANDGHTYCHQCTWNDVPEDKQCVAWLPGRCRNAAVRDGYCGEHHPDAPVRREITREENEFLRGLVRELTAALINGAPIEALQDKCPLVLYFGNPADRDELVAAIKAIKTNFVEVKLPPEKV